MKRFVALYLALDASTSTLAKVAALKRYLAQAPARDAAWAVYLLAGGTPRRAVPTHELRALACEAAGLPEWLFEAGYAATGDLAEAIAYVLPDPADRLD
ncbi:MAG TPA: ATP-dependent DNA ligase, partial [Roseateles sp.]|nr:ATP-dependent DNA ligase [Roseateles sp.]